MFVTISLIFRVGHFLNEISTVMSDTANQDRRDLDAIVRSWKSDYCDLVEQLKQQRQALRKQQRSVLPSHALGLEHTAVSQELLSNARSSLIQKTVSSCTTVEPFILEKVPFGIAFTAMTLLHFLRKGAIVQHGVQPQQNNSAQKQPMHLLSFQRSHFVSFWTDVILEVIRLKSGPHWKRFMTYVCKEHIFGMKRCAGTTSLSFETLLDRIQEGPGSEDALRSCDISSMVSMGAPSEERMNEFHHSHHDKHTFGHLVLRTGEKEFRALFSLLKALKRKENEVGTIKLLFIFFEAELVARYTNTRFLHDDSQQSLLIRSRLELLHKTLLRSMYTFGPRRPASALHSAILEKVKSLDFIDRTFWKRNLKQKGSTGIRYCRALSEAELQVCVMAVVEHRVSRDDILPIAIALLSHHTKPEYLRPFLDRTLAPILRSFDEEDSEEAVHSSLALKVPQHVVKCLAAVLLLNLLHSNRGIRNSCYTVIRALSMSYTNCRENTSEEAPMLFDYIGARMLSSHFGAALLDYVLFDASVDKRLVFPSSALLYSLHNDNWRRFTWKALLSSDFHAVNFLAQHAEKTCDPSACSGFNAPPVDVCSALFSPDAGLRHFYTECALTYLTSVASKTALSGTDSFCESAESLDALKEALHVDSVRNDGALMSGLTSSVQKPLETDLLTQGITRSLVYNCITRQECRSQLEEYLKTPPSFIEIDSTITAWRERTVALVMRLLIQSSAFFAEKISCEEFFSFLVQLSIDMGNAEEVDFSEDHALHICTHIFTDIGSIQSHFAYKTEDKSVQVVTDQIVHRLLPAIRSASGHLSKRIDENFDLLEMNADTGAPISENTAKRLILSIWRGIIRLVQLPALCTNNKLIHALKASVLLIPENHKLFGVSLLKCIQTHGVAAIHYWRNALCSNVQSMSFILAAAMADHNGKSDSASLVTLLDITLQESQEKVCSDTIQHIKFQSSPQTTSFSSVYSDLKQFGMGLGRIKPILKMLEHAGPESVWALSGVYGGIVDSLSDIHSLWTQTIVLAFCVKESFAAAIIDVFKMALSDTAAKEPFDLSNYIERSNSILSFVSATIAAIHFLTASQEDWNSCAHELKDESGHGGSLPQLPPAPEESLHTLKYSAIQSISSLFTIPDEFSFVSSAIQHILMLSLQSFESAGNRISNFESQADKSKLLLLPLLEVIERHESDNAVKEITLATLRIHHKSKEASLPPEQSTSAHLPSTNIASPPMESKIIDDTNDFQDDQSFPSASVSDEIPPEALHSAVLAQSTDSPSSPSTANTSDRPSSGSNGSPQPSSPSLSQRIGAVSYAVDSSTKQILANMHRRSFPDVSAVPYAPTEMTSVQIRAIDGQTPCSAIMDMRYSPQMAQPTRSAYQPPPVAVIHDSVDLSRMQHAMANQSRESAAEGLQSPWPAEVQNTIPPQRIERRVPVVGNLPGASVVRNLYKRMFTKPMERERSM